VISTSHPSVTVIVNLHSAGGQTGVAWPAIQTALVAEFGAIQSYFTQARGHAVELTRQALQTGTTLLIVLGGDGTLNEVVNGFFDDNGRTSQPAPVLGVLLCGTGGDFGRSCELPRHWPDAIHAIKTLPPQPCDVGRLRFLQPQGGTVRYFINVADVGVGGDLVDVVNRSPKILGGPLTFFLAGLWVTFFHYRNAPLFVELDGQILSSQARQYFVAIANGTHFGSGMHIAPAAQLNDGIFDVVLVGDLTLPEKFYFAYKLYQGRSDELPKVRQYRGRRVTIRSPRPVLIEADGELVGATDVECEMLPAAVQLAGFKSMRR
jgi:diacylglycerol kinase (ATP)